MSSDTEHNKEELAHKFRRPLELCYNMHHKKRGLALIFNHEEFVNNRRRRGTHIDRDRLKKTFTSLDFKVKIYENRTKSEIVQILQKVAGIDHSNNDCLVVIFLTHGEIKKFRDDGACDTILNHDAMSHLHALDGLIPVHMLCEYFTDENCPTLSNKPRIFLIQACQDEKNSNEMTFIGDVFNDEIDLSAVFTFPQKDFLIGYSSMPGTKSFRTTGNGSWFIESLCAEMGERGATDDLFGILTSVSLRVSRGYESYECDIAQNKQIPCINSRLTKLMFFPKKSRKNLIYRLFSRVKNSKKSLYEF